MDEDLKKRCWASLLGYADGATIPKACLAARVSTREFYGLMRLDPEYRREYEALRRLRSDMVVDEMLDILADEPDAKKMRARIDGGAKTVALMYPDRYGDRMRIEVEEKPSLLPALRLARERAGVSIRDLAPDSDGTYRAIPGVAGPRAPDRQSDVRPDPRDLARAYEPPDPFE